MPKEGPPPRRAYTSPQVLTTLKRNALTQNKSEFEVFEVVTAVPLASITSADTMRSSSRPATRL